MHGATFASLWPWRFATPRSHSHRSRKSIRLPITRCCVRNSRLRPSRPAPALLPPMFDLAVQTVLILAVAAFVAGFVDSIAGGGGLITVPALLLAGFSPVAALGTNKLQGLFGSGSATLAYAAKGHVDLRHQLPSALMALAGGVLGALAATVVPAAILSAALPIVLVAIALYFAIKPNMGDIDRARRLSPFLFGLMIVPAIGFYDGIFGPGAGSFYMLAFVSLAGFGILK